MVFQKPRIEFVKLELEDVIATSDPGPGYNVCEKHGISGMDQNAFCAAMNVAGMPL